MAANEEGSRPAVVDDDDDTYYKLLMSRVDETIEETKREKVRPRHTLDRTCIFVKGLLMLQEQWWPCRDLGRVLMAGCVGAPVDGRGGARHHV